MQFPAWIDLKGQDSVPDTVHHVVVVVDPKTDQTWRNPRRSIATDGVHRTDQLNPQTNSPGTHVWLRLLNASNVEKKVSIFLRFAFIVAPFDCNSKIKSFETRSPMMVLKETISVLKREDSTEKNWEKRPKLKSTIRHLMVCVFAWLIDWLTFLWWKFFHVGKLIFLFDLGNVSIQCRTVDAVCYPSWLIAVRRI